MRGVIVRVHLKQFMVFTDFELRPERNVNLVIAPNGCGKSSLIAGIMLGLGGKPNDIGRASHVGDFVKSGCKEGSIEIELLNPGKNYIIQRNITYGSNKSTWFVNGDKVLQKQVEDLMSKLHIQVDNLCQVLPQDRVCEFSRMNPQTLLDNTEKSVGPEILTKYHSQLKDLSRIREDCNKKLKDKSSRLERESAINQSLHSKVVMMVKKTEFMKKIKLYKQQRAWVVYNEQYMLVKEMKTSLNEAKLRLKSQKMESDKITAGMETLRRNVKQLTDNTRIKNEAKMNLEHKLQAALAQAVQKMEELKSIDDRLVDAKEAEVVRLRDLESLRHHLSKLENDLANYNSVSEEQTTERISQTTDQILLINQAFTEVAHEQEKLREKIENIKYGIRVESEKKRRLEDRANQRLDRLKSVLPQVYKAVMWLRQNENMFQAKIHEPMLLEIDVRDDSYIKYVENTISPRDLTAFTCENLEDMNKFVFCVREENKLAVSAVYSGPEHKPSTSFRPIVPVDDLPSFGFSRYVKDMFTAPEAIMKYLCRTAHVHLIAVGSSEIDGSSDSLPDCFSIFYSDTSKYVVKVSRYTRGKIVAINSINFPKLLCKGVDKNEVDKINAKIQELSLEKEGLDVQLSALEEKRKGFERQLGELRDEKRRLQASIGGKDSTERRIKSKRKAIEDLEAEGINVEEETRKANLEKNVVVVSLCRIDEKIQILSQKLDEAIREFAEVNSKLCEVREQFKKRENDARSTINALHEQNAKVQKCEQEYARARDEGKHYYQEALKICNGEKPPDSFFENISDDRETLSRKIQELKAKADFMNEENINIITEYENRKKLIKEITDDIQQLNGKICEMNKSVLEIREKWLPDLQDFVERINHNFGRYFAKLGCAGEVMLHSDDPDNYDQYGIYIKVKFRDGDKLQDLNHYTQSGGERSVATALYMISMQELTQVPFRCVDEINQGMDPVNERKVFQLLVNVTEDEEDSPQYFLLTPKLLPGLTYSDKINITCIMNGSVRNNMGCWNAQKQIEARRNWKSKKK